MKTPEERYEYTKKLIEKAKQETTKKIFEEIDKIIPRGISPYWDKKERLKQKYLKEGE